MKYGLTFLLILTTLVSFAQKEASNWYFGNKAGLKFNPDGTVTALSDGQLITTEGSASISNSNGDLLFYTDGKSIWDKNHIVMPNADYEKGTGLFGDGSSTQSGIIVPKPGNPNLYYVFTIDEPHHENAAVYPKAFSGTYLDYASGRTPDNDDGLNNGLNYSIVDITKIGSNGSIGDVISRNNPLITYNTDPFGEEIKYKCSEKLTAIRSSNENSYWVITHSINTFYAFKVTSAGVISTPIKSVVTPNAPLSGYRRNAIGYLKASPNGKKLAAAFTQNSIVNNEDFTGTAYLYDFDATTGIVSKPIKLISNTDPYGVEFSPDSNVLYISYSYVLSQFDLKSTNIPNSKVVVFESEYSIDGLQLGPNKKIYVCTDDFDALSVINSPNSLGTNCDFVNKQQLVAENTSVQLGLPPFITSFFSIPFIANQLCAGSPTTFQLTSTEISTDILWDFGDGATATSLSPSHTYTSAGTYTVSATITTTEGTSTETKEIIISTVPKATTPQNISYCDTNNDGLATFDLTTQNTAILNGQNPSQYKVTYYANATDYAARKAIANPTAYINPVAYQTETLIAEVANVANAECKASCSFTLAVFDSPKPKANTAILPIQKCDDTSFGTDSDRKVVFDLTQRATSILNGQSASQFVLSYYKDAALTQSIPNPAAYVNTDPFEIIYVKMAHKDNLSCVESTYFAIEVLGLPVIISPVDLKQCDDDTDGFSRFNLKEAEGKISLNSGALFSYFKIQTDAQNNTNPIANPTAYTNNVASIDKVYVRVATTLGCFRIAELNLIVSTTQIPISFTKTFTQCDDSTSGSNTDGISQFDFSSVTTAIQNQFPTGQQLEIRYFKTLNDALAEQNAIPNPANYSNTDSPFSQDIYVRVDSKLDNACLGLGKHVHLVVERIPIATPQKIVRCDDNQDGKFPFETSGIQTNLLQGMTNVSVAYFDKNNLALPSPLPNPFLTASQTLRVVLTNTTTQACSFETTIEFVVDDLPEAFPISATATSVCDDELDPMQQDGKFAFSTTGFQETILGGQTGMQVRYFDQNNVALPSPLPNPFVTHSQIVIAKVINPINTNCTAQVSIPFVVHQVPKIALVGDELVCSNLPTFTKVIDAGILDGSAVSNYTYQWTFNTQPVVGANSNNLTVNTAGTYTVTTTNSNSCLRTRTITVVASDSAKITNVAIVDLATENSITVSVTGSGDYVYSLDELSGPYQTEAVFNSVKAGIHTVYVKDLNGCGISSKEVAVLGIPVFFTPNGDGHNDFWNIKGVNVNFNYKTIVYIFDRYGKLLKELDPTSEGWDGTFTSQALPADDYWYTIQLEDGRVFKGHFALKR